MWDRFVQALKRFFTSFWKTTRTATPVDYGDGYKPTQRYQDYDEARERAQLRLEVDRILEKISDQGVESLSKAERKTLEDASKQMR